MEANAASTDLNQLDDIPINDQQLYDWGIEHRMDQYYGNPDQPSSLPYQPTNNHQQNNNKTTIGYILPEHVQNRLADFRQDKILPKWGLRWAGVALLAPPAQPPGPTHPNGHPVPPTCMPEKKPQEGGQKKRKGRPGEKPPGGGRKFWRFLQNTIHTTKRDLHEHWSRTKRCSVLGAALGTVPGGVLHVPCARRRTRAAQRSEHWKRASDVPAGGPGSASTTACGERGAS